MGQGSKGERSGRRPPNNPSPIPSIVRSRTTRQHKFSMGQGLCGERCGRHPPRNPSPIPSVVRGCTTKATAFFYGTRFKGVTLHPFDLNAHIHKAKPNYPMGPSLPLASVRRPFENRISNTFDEFCLPNFIFIFA